MNATKTGWLRGTVFAMSLGLLVAGFPVDAATWTANTSGYWTNSATWGAGTPQPGDDVVISASKFVTVDVTTVYLSTFTNNGTLVFVGTNTALQATNVLLNGTVTHPIQSALTTNTDGKWYADNRVWFVCSNLTLVAGKSINVDGMGYQGGVNISDSGKGPGGSMSTNNNPGAGGAGYGGQGGSANTPGGVTYGDPSAPLDPGSGGGFKTLPPYTSGGGTVRIQATGCVTINGVVTARGTDHTNRSGGGSGGGIYITCSTFQGTGRIAAAGGFTGGGGGGGGGGRVALIYDTVAQTNVSPKPTAQFSAAYGTGPDNNGAPGTVYMPDMNFFPYAVLTNSCRILVSNTTTFALSSLTLSNCYVIFGDASLQSLTVSNDMTILGASGRYDVTTNTFLAVGGNLTLTNGAKLYAFSGVTNGVAPDYGARVSVTGDVVLASTNCWVYPYSHNENGASPIFQMRNLRVVTTNAGFDANQKGYRGGTNNTDRGKGPGGSASVPNGSGSGGAGYGGRGGNAGSLGGTNYDAAIGPLSPGSGSGYCNQGPTPVGGGFIRIEATDTVTLNGTLTANGGSFNNRSGGASGGGIYVKCTLFNGSNGTFSAIGGNSTGGGYGGGGGGGRIAVLRKYQFWSGAITNVAGGTASGGGGIGETGTIRWVQSGAEPLIATLAATNISYTWANLNGSLSSTGTAETAVWVYWGLSDQNTNKSLWDTNVTFGVMTADQMGLTTNITGLIPGTNYYCRFYASNSVGETWAPASTNFATPAPLPTISNAVSGATSITLVSATLNGYLAATGTSPTTVSVYWGQSDAGTNSNAPWTYTNDFGYQNVGALATNVTLPVSNTYYYYRYAAVNSGGRAWADPLTVFMAGEVGVNATMPNAQETGPVSGTVTVYRASSLTNLAITVNYAIGGSATLGSDYTLTPAGTNIVMAAGVSNVTIAVNPIWDDTVEGTETVALTLTPGQYAPAAQNSATVSIADAVINVGSNGTLRAGDWSVVTNWSQGRPPVAGDDVYIANDTTLTNASRPLNSLTVLAGKTLTFYGTNTSLTAVNVTISGIVTHAVESAITTNADGKWYADNRVWLVCTNLTVATNGSINVDTKGYQGGTNATDIGKGPGGTTSGGGGANIAGAGHGAIGGGPGGAAYDNPAQPVEPGSGGGFGGSSLGGNGGGLVRIDASSLATVNGTITARGGNGTDRSGPGSGGSIFLTCDTIQGAGAIRADAANADVNGGSGAAGGRVAVVYNPVSQAGVSPKPTVQLSAAHGLRSVMGVDGNLGTVYVTDTNFFPYTVLTSGCRIMVPGVFSWALSSLTLSNSWLLFGDGEPLTVAGDFTILGSKGRYDLTNTSLTVGGNLTLTNGAQLYVTSGPTNGGAVDYGALVSVAGELAVTTNCWIYPYSHNENGGSPFFRVGSLRVLTNAGINADNKGFRGGTNEYNAGRGPGGSAGSAFNSGSGGGGYGGQGGNSMGTAGGGTYGNSNAPALPGSGSGYVNSGGVPAGGGLVRVEAAGPITLNGLITANGGDHGNRSGGGSGGGIYLRSKRVLGAGQMTARGGNCTGSGGGGGGGGRIAVYTGSEADWSGATDVSGGIGYNAGSTTDDGQPGTVVWIIVRGSIYTFR